MIDIFIIILLILLLAVLYFHIDRDIFAPWFITVAIWLVVLGSLKLSGDLLYPISDQFRYCLIIWIAVFCSSSLLTFKLMPEINADLPNAHEGIPVSKVVFNVFYVITLIITPLYVYKIIQIVSQFDSTDMLANIRILALYGDNNWGFLRYSYVINHVLLAIALWQYPNLSKLKLATIFVAMLLSAFAIMEKGTLFYTFIATAYVLYERKIIRVRSLLIGAFALVMLFFFINIVRTLEADSGGESSSLLDFIGMYVLSPVIAFGTISEDITMQFGSHSFNIIYLFLERFGADVVVYDKIQEFVYVPIPTNVYTIFQPFFEDFGYSGILVFGLAYGFLCGMIYRLMRNGSGSAKCIYTYIVYVLVLQFFQEIIMLNLVLFIQYVFFTLIITQQKLSFKTISQ